MARKKEKKVYFYKCSITEQKYKTTRPADNPDDLVSVSAYYDLNPEEDDRPEHIKLEVKREDEAREAMQAMAEMAAMQSEEESNN